MTTDSKLILDLAHRIAWRYKKSSDPNHSDTYTFNESTLLQFAEALAAHRSEQKGEPSVKESLTAQDNRRELVNIVWNTPDSDWPWFYMLDTKPGWVKLKGADYPDGTAKHRGDVFWSPESAIKAMSAKE